MIVQSRNVLELFSQSKSAEVKEFIFNVDISVTVWKKALSSPCYFKYKMEFWWQKQPLFINNYAAELPFGVYHTEHFVQTV